MTVVTAARGVVKAESAIRKDELESAAGTWDGEKVEVSRYALDLKQLDNGVKIPPRGWKCSRCDLTENLWLNLTDGTILCGRRFFDGSGGNNHAVDHYNETKYPLVRNPCDSFITTLWIHTRNCSNELSVEVHLN